MSCPRWIGLCVDHRRRVTVAFVAATLVWSAGLARLRLATDGRALLPDDHPAVVRQAEIDRAFGAADQVIVGVEAKGPAGLCSPVVLEAVRALTREVEAVPGIDGPAVASLATVVSPSWSDAGLVLAPPLAGGVGSPAEAAAVCAAVAADPLLAGFLVSSDGRSTAIYAPAAAGADHGRSFHEIEAAAARVTARLDPAGRHLAVHLLGPAAAESLLGEHVLADLAMLLPLALLVVAAVMGLWFRQPAAVVVGLGEAVAVVLWSLGLLAAAGKPLSLVTVVMPVILATYCISDTIHIAQRYLEKRRAAPALPRAASMKDALAELWRPVALTSITTCAGFASFAVSPIPPVRDFGVFTALGVLAALGVSLAVVPGALLLCGFEARAGAAAVQAPVARRLGRAMRWAARRPLGATVAIAAATALLAAGIPRLAVQDSWVANFDPDGPLRRADRWFDRGFAGSHVLQVVVEAPPGGAVWEPAFLAVLSGLEAELRRLPEVGGALSVADQLAAVGRTFEGAARLPASLAESRQWALLWEAAGGADSLAAAVDPAARSARVRVFLRQADDRRTVRVAAAAERHLAAHGGGAIGGFAIAGDAWLGHVLVSSIARGLWHSQWLALALNLGLVLLLTRRLLPSLLVVLPVSLAVVWNFGAMGWGGLPLGVATSTFSAIALGIGVDFALHWVARLRIDLERGAGLAEAVERTAASAGGAILLHGVVLVLGFAVLLASAVPPNRRLGLLMCGNVAACLVTTLFLLPALAGLLRHRLRLAPEPAGAPAVPRPARRWRPSRLGPLALAAGLALVAGAARAEELPPGLELMRRVNARPAGGDARLELRLTLRDDRRGDSVQRVELRRKAVGGGYRSLYRLTAPPHLEGIALLVGEEPALAGMWMYFPSNDQVVRVATRGLSALASDFTCEDLRVTFALDDLRFRTLGRESAGGRTLYRIEMVPATERLQRELGHARAVGWVEAGSWLVVRAEFFDQRGQLFKSFTADPPVLIDGVWTLPRSTMVNHRAGHSTEVEVVTARYRLDLPLAELEPQGLGAWRDRRGGRRP